MIFARSGFTIPVVDSLSKAVSRKDTAGGNLFTFHWQLSHAQVSLYM